MVAPTSGGESFFATWQRWRDERRQRRQLQRQQNAESQLKAARLKPKYFADGILLPITGDFVVPRYVNGIQVRNEDSRHEVVVSTLAKEYIVPCSTNDEAETIRRNIALVGDLLHQSGSY